MKEELQDENQNAELSESDVLRQDTSLPPIPGKYRVMRRNGKVTSYAVKWIKK